MLYDAVNVGDQKSWCGPTVVAAITGLTVPAVKARIKKYRGHNGAVMGTSSHELRVALGSVGYHMFAVGNWKGEDRPTLAQWLKEPAYRLGHPEDAYVLDVGYHWVVVKGRWFCDTYTKGVPVRATKAPHRRKRVREVYRVFKR